MLDQLKKIFLKIMDVEVAEDSTNQTIEKWDSLNHLKLILELERSFQVSFNVDDIPEMTSIPQIIEKLKEKGIK